MKITAISRQKRLQVNLQAAEALARFFLQHPPWRGTEVSSWGEITLTLVDHATMREANTDFFEKTETTDVISATYNPIPGADGRHAADIIVNAEMAISEGTKRPRTRSGLPWGITGELALYIAHGCDHLLGGEDHAPKERQAMRRRELRWLQQAREKGLLETFVGALLT